MSSDAVSSDAVSGADVVIETLLANGVDVCFTNPGTTEMHLVAALDRYPAMRGVLTLFEGVATGAADGYARMTDRPAATLLHLGPGLGNGIANLHNARRARSPVVNIVGDHAADHIRFDTPLTSDITTLARNVSPWCHTVTSVETLERDTAAAVAVARSILGQVATLILPADIAWKTAIAPPLAPTNALSAVALAVESAVGSPSALAGRESPETYDHTTINEICSVLTKRSVGGSVGGNADEPEVAFLLGGHALRADSLAAAGRIAQGTGARFFAETFPARIQRGVGRVRVERLSYLADFASIQLAGIDHLILVGAQSPASFFAYLGMPSDLVPDGCKVLRLAGSEIGFGASLTQIADAVGIPTDMVVAQEALRPIPKSGPLTAESFADVIGALLPPDAIVVDEAQTSGIFLDAATAGCPPHDWLTLTGGAIGMGMPLATGAAVACPDRRVLNLQADGSAMYTLQALWTQARENLDVTTVILNNGSYAILGMELDRATNNTSGPIARSMTDISTPPLDFAVLARGMGVTATRATTTDELHAQLSIALASPSPHLIDAAIRGLDATPQ